MCFVAVEEEEEKKLNVEAYAVEWHLYVRPWGFNLAEIEVPLFLWYGTEDSFAPVHMGCYLATQIPTNQLREGADGAHFSTINNHIEEIFADLISTTASSSS